MTLPVSPADECQAMLTWSEIRLCDAEIETLSIHGRVDAVFDSIYSNLWSRARSSGYPVPEENPNISMMLFGAKLAGLSPGQTAMVMELMYFVCKNRHQPKLEVGMFPRVLSIAQELAHLSWAGNRDEGALKHRLLATHILVQRGAQGIIETCQVS